MLRDVRLPAAAGLRRCRIRRRDKCEQERASGKQRSFGSDPWLSVTGHRAQAQAAQRRARVDEAVAVIVVAPGAPRSVAYCFIAASIAAGLVMPCCISSAAKPDDVRRRHRRALEVVVGERIGARRAELRRRPLE